MHSAARKVSSALIVAVAVVGAGALVASTSLSFAKSDKASEKSMGAGKVAKTDKGTVNVKQEAKNFEKADRRSKEGSNDVTTPGKSNASLHREKVEEVTQTLEDVAKKEKQMNKEMVAQQIEDVVEEGTETSDEAADAIVEVESRNKFKQLLIGSDYKNLGQLRSSLVKNENQIRKLTRTLENVRSEDRTAVEDQLLALTQERERIKTVITDNEGGFSLLGWVFRFLNGYPDESIDQTSEDALTQDVQDALDSAGAADDGSMDGTDGTTEGAETSETTDGVGGVEEPTSDSTGEMAEGPMRRNFRTGCVRT